MVLSSTEYGGVIYGPNSLVISDVKVQPTSSCLILNNEISIEQAVYTFEVSLEVSPSSYFISYQRCCRNQQVLNIENPTSTGATVWVEINAAAQIQPVGQSRTPNSSPAFLELPAAAVCLDEPFSLNLTALDDPGESDSLVFAFFNPRSGGGPNLTQPKAKDGVYPDPESPPPYDASILYTPGYAVDQPLGISSNLSINAQTGEISGTPTEAGVFLIGVEVSEYNRVNQDLFSTVRLEYQLIVDSCFRPFEAMVETNALATDGTPLINTCGVDLDLVNTSTGDGFDNEFFDSREWQIDFPTPQVYNSTDVNANAPQTGYFGGRLILKATTGCLDTFEFDLEIFPEMEADFESAYDPCIENDIELINNSAADGGLFDSEWRVNGIFESSISEPTLTDLNPGIYDVSLITESEQGCRDSVTESLAYYPIPDIQTEIPVNNSQYCAPQEVTIDLSTVLSPDYVIDWDFGDGAISQGRVVTHAYLASGQFDLTVEIDGGGVCNQVIDVVDFIDVIASPRANFFFNPVNPTNLSPDVTFQDRSSDAEQIEWTISGVGVFTEPEVEVSFPDSGTYFVQLVAFNPLGCSDTLVQSIRVASEIRMYIPNAFSPNGDGFNDFFIAEGPIEGISNYSLVVMDRWGNLVFESNDPLNGWNGRVANTGKKLDTGVYVYGMRFVNPEGEIVIREGGVTLLRD